MSTFIIVSMLTLKSQPCDARRESQDLRKAPASNGYTDIRGSRCSPGSGLGMESTSSKGRGLAVKLEVLFQGTVPRESLAGRRHRFPTGRRQPREGGRVLRNDCAPDDLSG